MPRRKLKKKLTQADKGRAIIKETKVENVAALAGYDIDEPVQYYYEGWRFGYVRELPVKGLNRGRVRVENSVTHRKVWVDGTGLKKLEPAHDNPPLPRPVGAAVPLQ